MLMTAHRFQWYCHERPQRYAVMFVLTTAEAVAYPDCLSGNTLGSLVSWLA
jgi:hypothetical protein